MSLTVSFLLGIYVTLLLQNGKYDKCIKKIHIKTMWYELLFWLLFIPPVLFHPDVSIKWLNYFFFPLIGETGKFPSPITLCAGAFTQMNISLLELSSRCGKDFCPNIALIRNEPIIQFMQILMCICRYLAWAECSLQGKIRLSLEKKNKNIK